MPRKVLAGSFTGHPHYRWVRMIDDVRYTLLCRSRREGEPKKKNTDWLGLPRERWTKIDSLPFANKWWEAHLGPSPRLQKIMDADPVYEEFLREEPEFVQAMNAIPKILDYVERHQKIERTLDRAGISKDLAYKTGIVSKIREVVDQIEEPSPILNIKSIVSNLSTFLEQRKKDVGVEITTGTYDNLRRNLEQLKKFNDPDKSVDDINYDWWHDWHLHCKALENKRSAAWASEVFSCGKQFVKWLWEREAIATLPRNFKKYSISVERKTVIPTFSIEEIKTLVSDAQNQLKLHLLLMANCAFTQVDISTLSHSMVDLKAGTITRKRAKTGKRGSTPLVVYPLWKVTLNLMKKYQSKDPELFLLTESGKPWLRRDLKPDGEMSRTDAIMSNFRHLQAKTGIKGKDKSLKIFRKTSANLLADHVEFRQIAQLFLGHAANSVMDTNYVNAANGILRKGIAWLGKQYGFK